MLKWNDIIKITDVCFYETFPSELNVPFELIQGKFLSVAESLFEKIVTHFF